jgi:hypothetical protein
MIGDLTFQIAMLRARVAELEAPPPPKPNGKGKEPENAPLHHDN